MDEGEIDNVVHLFREGSASAGDSHQADEAKQRWAALWQTMYVHRGQSLADPETADSLRVAVEVIALLTRGACATGKINEEQRDYLVAAVETGLFAADELGS